MKLDFKALTLLLSAGVIFSLSGCGSSSSDTPADGPSLGDQTILPDGSIEYIDYTGEPRIAPPSAADAEYHTGVGYGNTLFDSADNKCMNCHNELYDTWEKSMHGQSWVDPIFQSKFQDFLRTHLAKIGETKAIQYEQAAIIDGDGVGTKNMFSGAAQTCIKCHAPGAYYAGDVQVTVTEVQDATDVNNTALRTLKTELEVTDPNGQIAVIAANSHQNKIYKATFQIGHEANREGINCAFCHSIETPRLMKEDGMDMGTYTLKKDLRVGPHGPVKAAAGTDLTYNDDATNGNMNKFFRLWGPEKYADYNATPKGVNPDHNAGEFDEGKTFDGRYTMHSIDINNSNDNGEVHFTGGPYYGPFGVSGKSNENETDETNRTALINPHYDKDNNNHFGANGKGLCLSCHQRSAGAAVPAGEDGAGQFMELCSTQMAVTTGGDIASNDSLSSPKCQKCHMERIEGDLLHQWARPDLDFDAATFKAAVGYDLTPELDKDVNTSVLPEGEAPERDGWFNSHAFLGASKTGQKASVTAKIQSGFEADVTQNIDGNTLTVTTSLKNLTAHMFPGAHPMRRVLTRVIVTSDQGVVEVNSSKGISTFADIEGHVVQPLQDKTLHPTAAAEPVPVHDVGSENLDFPGKVADLSGAAVSGQKFDMTAYTITGVDATVSFLTQSITNGVTEGTVKNSAIVEDDNRSTFTRVYGHETGKRYAEHADTFIVRPGFDSNMVDKDTRLSPNETETYTLTYDIEGKTNPKVEYRVYYMQKGANGKFIVDPATGFLNQAASDALKLLVTEVYKYPELP